MDERKRKHWAVCNALADELERLGEGVMAMNARSGYYSDFGSPLELPKITLVDELRGKDHRDLMKRVMEGEFDG